MALALGLLPSEVENMPVRDYEMLERYWMHEPWGAWRDNLHAALIAMEVIRPNLKKGARISLDAFMVRHPDDLVQAREQKRTTATRNLFQLFKAMATKRPYQK